MTSTSFTPHLIFARVLYDLCAQIAGFDGAQVLLITLSVAGILVNHVWCTSFCLRLNDGVPQLLSLHHTLSPALLLISENQDHHWDRLALGEKKKKKLFVENRVCCADLTECRAPQTPPPSIRPIQDIHWDTSETSPTITAEG